MSHQVQSLGHVPISDHSFSADRSQLALARDISVEIYDTGSKYNLKTTLSGHDKTVTSVDIAPHSGRIVTCSQDRNALVWEPSPDGTYKPTLVLLRINRAATCARWSPDEKKFAVGSGARAIAVCYFEEENDWWVSKHIKKPLRSTVLSVSWHPNSVLLAAGSTDSHARVFSTFIKGVDARPEPTIWGERVPFQTLCGDFVSPAGGWVHDAAFSPSGNALALVTHDSSITIVYPSGPEQPPAAVVNVSTTLLPFKSLVWLSENEIIAAGHDCHPVIFTGSDQSGWVFDHSVDDPNEAKKNATSRENTALNMFRQMDLKGTPQASADDASLPTIHQNTITKLRPYAVSGGRVNSVSSTGVDGRVVIFDV
ncbi:WD40-repeat-containing domain protein [Lipomyces chichibuensis]|uniref:WD40-repeat-containing domain protein n=1 Tax=Lipomyces chichibuensis TaxID=1546026 RepID=UPI003343E0CF